MWKAILEMDSLVLKALLVAIGGLLGLVLNLVLGINDVAFVEKYGQVVDAVLLVVSTFAAVVAAHARVNRPNPNLSPAADAKEKELIEAGKLPVDKATVGVAREMNKIQGFIRAEMLGIILALGCIVAAPALMTSCVLFEKVAGVECRDFNDCADIAYDSAKEWSKTVTAMNDAGQLSDEDALASFDTLEAYIKGIGAARKIAQVNEADGRARLQAVSVGLNALIVYLESKKGST